MNEYQHERSLVLTEWEMATPRTHPALAGVSLAELARKQTSCWRESGWVDIVEERDGLRVEAFAFAGTLHLATSDGVGLNLDIRPKMAPQTAATFVRYALGLDIAARQDTARAPLQKNGLQDILAMLLLDEADEVMHRGLLRDYRRHNEWLSSPRGQIQFSELARQPLPTRLAVPCRFTAHSADVPLNRLLLAALKYVAPQVTEPRLRFGLQSRAAILGTVCKPMPFNETLWQAAHLGLDRRSGHYEGAVQLARLLLDAIAPGLSDGRRESVPGFLFNMNVLFEKFVTRMCQEHAPPGITVNAQEISRESFRYRTNPHNWKRPPLRPDMVARHRGAPWLILDTKYKDLRGTRPEASDVYQLALYSMAFGQGCYVPARMVYPVENAAPHETLLEFTGFTAGQTLAQVGVVGLPLDTCARALQRRDRSELGRIVNGLLGAVAEPTLLRA